jgi:hypothetical protein
MSEPIRHEVNIIEQDMDFSRPEFTNPNMRFCTCFRCGATVLVRPGLDERPHHSQWHRDLAKQMEKL